VKDEVISRGLTVGDWILAGGVFVGGLAYALSVLDVRLGPLLGAVGIGGIAVALAARACWPTCSAASFCRSADRFGTETRSPPTTARAGSRRSTSAP
jgi:hypothetical protein